MAENVVLAEFQIKIDEVLEQAARLKTAMRELKEQQAILKLQGEEESEQYVKTEVQMKSLRAEYNRHVSMAQQLATANKTQANTQKLLAEAMDREVETINEARAANKDLAALRGDINTETEEGRKAVEAINQRIQENTQYIKENSKATQEAVRREDLLTHALEAEVRTIQEAREQNKLLNQLRNSTNVTTAEGRRELDLLNDKLDKNNEFIKENVDQYTQQKINVGNYTESIQEAWEGLDLFNGGLGGMISKSQEAGGVGALLAGTFKTVGTAIAGATKAALGFIATPLGAVVTVLAGAFLLVQNAISRSEDSTNNLSRAFSGFRGILSLVGKLLKPLGDLLISGIAAGMEQAEKATIGLMRALGRAADFFGWDSAAENLAGFANEMENSAEAARDLEEAQARLTKAQREAETIMKQYQERAENLRQIRDDESRSMEERIQANKDLGEVLEEQMREEMAIAQLRVQTAQDYIDQVGETTEALDLLGEANARMADVSERINSQRSEQLTNQNALLREQQTLVDEAAAKEIEASRQTLELYLLEQGTRKKEMREELELAEEVRDRRIEIAQKEYEASKKTENDRLALRIATVQAEQELQATRVDIAVSNAEREFEAFQRNLEKQKNELGEFSEEWLEIERARNNAILEEERKLADIRLREGVINQQERDAAIREAEETARMANEAADAVRREAAEVQERERRAAEIQAEMVRQEAEGGWLFDLERQRLEEQAKQRREELKEQLDKNLISRENYNAQLLLLEEQTAKRSKEITEAEQEAKREIIDAALTAVTDLVGKNSATGKAISVAQSMINTYQGITKALAASPPPFNYIAAATVAATGFKAVKDIIATKIPGAKGEGSTGTAGGGAGNAGGAGQLQTTAGAINRGATNAQVLGRDMDLAGGRTLAASGSSMVQGDVERAYNGSNLVAEVKEAVREGSSEGTRAGSQSGITELSENMDIRRKSAF